MTRIKRVVYHGPNPPQNLQTMDTEQLNAVLDFYIELPLIELRKRQSLNSQQLAMCAGHMSSEWVELAFNNLTIDGDILMYAVMFKTWPEDRGLLEWDSTHSLIVVAD